MKTYDPIDPPRCWQSLISGFVRNKTSNLTYSKKKDKSKSFWPMSKTSHLCVTPGRLQGDILTGDVRWARRMDCYSFSRTASSWQISCCSPFIWHRFHFKFSMNRDRQFCPNRNTLQLTCMHTQPYSHRQRYWHLLTKMTLYLGGGGYVANYFLVGTSCQATSRDPRKLLVPIFELS